MSTADEVTLKMWFAMDGFDEVIKKINDEIIWPTIAREQLRICNWYFYGDLTTA